MASADKTLVQDLTLSHTSELPQAPLSPVLECVTPTPSVDNAPLLPTKESSAKKSVVDAVEKTAAPEEAGPQGKSVPKRRFSLFGKKPEPAVMPVELTSEAISNLSPHVIRKINHALLQWIIDTSYAGSSACPALPTKDGKVKKADFLVFLRNGDVLFQLANSLEPGSLQAELFQGSMTPEDRERSLLQKFTIWIARLEALEDTKPLAPSDFHDKAGYPAVLNALWTLSISAQKYGKKPLNVEEMDLTEDATMFQKTLDYLKRPLRMFSEELRKGRDAQPEQSTNVFTVSEKAVAENADKQNDSELADEVLGGEIGNGGSHNPTAVVDDTKQEISEEKTATPDSASSYENKAAALDALHLDAGAEKRGDEPGTSADEENVSEKTLTTAVEKNSGQGEEMADPRYFL